MTEQTDQWPPISEALLKKLEDTFPAIQVGPGDDRDRIMYYSGKLDLIRYLRHRFEQQQQSAGSPGPTGPRSPFPLKG